MASNLLALMLVFWPRYLLACSVAIPYCLATAAAHEPIGPTCPTTIAVRQAPTVLLRPLKKRVKCSVDTTVACTTSCRIEETGHPEHSFVQVERPPPHRSEDRLEQSWHQKAQAPDPRPPDRYSCSTRQVIAPFTDFHRFSPRRLRTK